MSKRRNVTFTRPQDPSFLRRLKEQIGYKEGPTVDTKRQDLDYGSEEEFEDTHEEQPTVVVLKPGDLTAEEAERAKREAEEAPADLSKPITFKKPTKNKDPEKEEQQSSKRPSSGEEQKKKSKKPKKSVLSFNQDEEDEVNQ